MTFQQADVLSAFEAVDALLRKINALQKQFSMDNVHGLTGPSDRLYGHRDRLNGKCREMIDQIDHGIEAWIEQMDLSSETANGHDHLPGLTRTHEAAKELMYLLDCEKRPLWRRGCFDVILP